MFKEETLFILGAGASCSYGYPLGGALITDIINDMEDTILMPSSMYNAQHVPKDFLKLLGEDPNSITPDKFTFDKDYPITYFDSLALVNNKKIIDRPEFGALRTALVQFSPLSIDTFLRDNPSHSVAGNAMIIYSLLKRESKKMFETVTNKQPKTTDKEQDNWYPSFLNDLVSGCTDDPKKLSKDNKIEIITFNYDLSLEYFLYSQLSKTEIFKGTIADNFLKNFSCKHVYGSFYDKSLVESLYANYNENACAIYNSSSYNRSRNTRIASNFKRYVFALHYPNDIKTMYKKRVEADKKQYEDMIKKAKRIFFIGFGFDKDNLKQIGFPSTPAGYKKLLPGKTIYYLNYENRMTSLNDEFERIVKYVTIDKKSELTVIKSTNTRISDAYKYDFKPSLLS